MLTVRRAGLTPMLGFGSDTDKLLLSRVIVLLSGERVMLGGSI